MKDYSVLIFCFSNSNFLEVVKLSLFKVLFKVSHLAFNSLKRFNNDIMSESRYLLIKISIEQLAFFPLTN